MYEYIVQINNNKYIIIKSNNKNKKYDVLDKNYKYLLSFGDKRYEQYFDKFGEYKDLNHLNKKRRDNFRKRQKVFNIDNPSYPAFWSFNFLW